MYHSTPHSITGVNPAEFIFNLKLRDKVPTMKECLEVSSVWEQNTYHKTLSAERLKPEIVPGNVIEVKDKVLVKKPFSQQKSDSKFKGDTGTVTSVCYLTTSSLYDAETWVAERFCSVITFLFLLLL